MSSALQSDLAKAAQAVLDHAQPANYAADWVMVHRTMMGNLREALKQFETSRDDTREWVFLHRVGMVPERKGPFRNCDDTAAMLEALYAQHPDCICDVVTWHGEPWPDSGREYLDIRAAMGSSEKTSCSGDTDAKA